MTTRHIIIIYITETHTGKYVQRRLLDENGICLMIVTYAYPSVSGFRKQKPLTTDLNNFIILTYIEKNKSKMSKKIIGEIFYNLFFFFVHNIFNYDFRKVFYRGTLHMTKHPIHHQRYTIYCFENGLLTIFTKNN